MPKRIGRYEIVKELGRGGQAVVYAARDEEIGRSVALKVLLPGSRSRDAAARLAREARAAGKLDHENIVPVYDVGEFRGRQYLAMELVSGRSLSEVIPAGGMDPREAAEVLARIADAAHCAHLQGIIHRDIKPSNILVAPDGAPKLTDFGFALDEEAQSRLTHTGELMGTPSYMSPEQARGAPPSRSRPGHLTVEARSDVYSLGAVFYEMLTGRPPFTAETALALLDTIVNASPRRPSEINSGVPVDAETICLKCLSKEPGRRYASAGDLAADARRFLAGEPIRARPASLIYRARGMMARRLGAIAASLVGIAAFGGLAVWSRARIATAGADTARLRLEAGEELKALEAGESEVGALQRELEGALADTEETRRKIEAARAALAQPLPARE